MDEDQSLSGTCPAALAATNPAATPTVSPAPALETSRANMPPRAQTDRRYLEPGRGTHWANRAVTALTRMGISLLGSRVLYVRGRTSGNWRSTPVNLLTHEGQQYLVAARGHTQWVRNLRAAGSGELRVGRRVETFAARELDAADKPAVLRAYLRRWKFEVGAFFDGIDATSTDDELLRIAPGHPVFLVTEQRSAKPRA